jgi:ABC-type phosphate/phosphonate transport system substrate-binding protein
MSPRAPALPYVTRADAPDELVAQLRAALLDAMNDPSLDEARRALLLEDVGVQEREGYAEIARLEQAAVASGYPELL